MNAATLNQTNDGFATLRQEVSNGFVTEEVIENNEQSNQNEPPVLLESKKPTPKPKNGRNTTLQPDAKPGKSNNVSKKGNKSTNEAFVPGSPKSSEINKIEGTPILKLAMVKR
jgi:hypothetical protein